MKGLQVKNDEGAYRMASTMIAVMFQAIKRPQIIGKMTLRAKLRYWNQQLRWAKQARVQKTIISIWCSLNKIDQDWLIDKVISQCRKKIHEAKNAPKLGKKINNKKVSPAS